MCQRSISTRRDRVEKLIAERPIEQKSSQYQYREIRMVRLLLIVDLSNSSFALILLLYAAWLVSKACTAFSSNGERNQN